MEDWIRELAEIRGPLPVEPQYQLVTDDPHEDREGPIQATPIV